MLPAGVDGMRQAVAAERNAVRDLVQLAFRMQSAQSIAHLLAETHFHPDEWWVAEAGKSLVGCAGFLTRKTTLPALSIDWAVVLGVATHPHWQGLGIMSTLLELGIASVDERDIPISFLRGKRFRYSRFGWVEAGQRLGCTFSAAQFSAPQWPTGAVWHHVGTGEVTADAADLAHRVRAIQQSCQGCTTRSELAQLTMVARAGIHTFYINTGGEEAYAIVGEPQSVHLGWPSGVNNTSGLPWIYELEGSWGAVSGLVGYILQNHSGALHYLGSPWCKPVERLLWERASSFGVTTLGMIRIHNLARLLAMYKGWWETMPRFGSGSLVLCMYGADTEPNQHVRLSWTPATVEVESVTARQVGSADTAISGSRYGITNAIFGPLNPVVALPNEANAGLLRILFPVPLDLPRLDQI